MTGLSRSEEGVTVEQIQWVDPADMVSSNQVAKGIVKTEQGVLEVTWAVQYIKNMGSRVHVFLSNPMKKGEKGQWKVDGEDIYFWELARDEVFGWSVAVKGAHERLDDEDSALALNLYSGPGILVSPQTAVIIEKILRNVTRELRNHALTRAATAIYFLVKLQDAQRGMEYEVERMESRGSHPLNGAAQVEYWRNRIKPIKDRVEDSEWRVIQAIGDKEVLSLVLSHPDREIRTGAIMLAKKARDAARPSIMKI